MVPKAVLAVGLLGIVVLSGCGGGSPPQASGTPSTAPVSHPVSVPVATSSPLNAGNPSTPGSNVAASPTATYRLPNRLVYGNNQVTTFLTSTLAWRLNAMGVAAGSEGATLAMTTNGGTSWVTLSSTNPTGSLGLLPTFGDKDGVSFINPQVGWLTGSYPYAANAQPIPLFYQTHNGGRTWSPVRLPMPAVGPGHPLTLTPPAFVSADDGLLIGYLGSLNRVPPPFMLLWVTDDGGIHWQAVPASGSGHRLGFQWNVPQAGMVIMTWAGHSWETTNFGQSWQPYRSAPGALIHAASSNPPPFSGTILQRIVGPEGPEAIPNGYVGSPPSRLIFSST